MVALQLDFSLYEQAVLRRGGEADSERGFLGHVQPINAHLGLVVKVLACQCDRLADHRTHCGRDACDLWIRVVFVPARRHDHAEAELEATILTLAWADGYVEALRAIIHKVGHADDANRSRARARTKNDEAIGFRLGLRRKRECAPHLRRRRIAHSADGESARRADALRSVPEERSSEHENRAVGPNIPPVARAYTRPRVASSMIDARAVIRAPCLLQRWGHCRRCCRRSRYGGSCR